MDLLHGLDDNDLSDISLDLSMEADDSGIDACEVRRNIRNYEQEVKEEESSSSSDESDGEAARRMLRANIALRNYRNRHDENDKYGLNKVKKLYELKTIADLEGAPPRNEETEDDESILEVELTASGEDDEDSSVLELVIPMQNKFPKRYRFGVFQRICNFFCCKPFK